MSPLQAEDPLENRTILYQMVALYDYAAQGPEDLDFSQGDTVDILGEGEAPAEVKVRWTRGPTCPVLVPDLQ